MLSCESCEYLMADALYEPLPSKKQSLFQAHLAQCSRCEQLFHELREAGNELRDLGLQSSRYEDIPERAALEDVWQHLEPALDEIDRKRNKKRAARSVYPFLSGAVAMAASLLLFIAVTGVDVNSPRPVEQIAEQSAQRLISPELMDYLTRAETMLLLVANSETENVSVVPLNGAFARNMASEANFMTSTMDDSINSGESRLLKDIEFLLLQIANLDESNMAEGIRLLQDYIEDNSVFLKIRMLEMRDQDSLI